MTLEQKIAALLEKFVPTIRETFLAAIQDIVDRAILNEIIQAIEAGDVVGAYRAIGFSDAAMRPVVAMIEQAFEQGGVVTGSSFPGRLNTPVGKAVFRFDVRNSRAEAWLRDESASLVTRMQEDARVAVQNVLTDGIAAGRSPRSVALDMIGRVDPTQGGKRVGGVVGLTVGYERAVSRARAELEAGDYDAYLKRERRFKTGDRTVLKAQRTGVPLTKDQIQKLVTGYSNGLLKLRGENIARTETIASLNKAQYEAVKQAADMGAINKSATRFEWDSAGDMRVRHTHRKMDGQRVQIDEPFTAPGGARLLYPGDTSLNAPGSETVNCRCRLKVKIDWLAGVK